MTKSEAQTEVFWMAFTALPRDGQRDVLNRMLHDDSLRQDLMDLALMEQRWDEPTTPLRDYLKTRLTD